MPTVVIGTAGHIDHGKTALLRALTGMDADRLPEERSRGMTIDVGYAHLAFDDGTELDFVDVPGHDRLIGNMLVGAGEIDAAMLVVAADDGPRPQTIEHVQLLDALGIDDGVAVVTKVDLVDPARVAEVEEAVRRLLLGTSMAGARVLHTSATSGAGIDELRVALREIDRRVRERLGVDPGGMPRLAVDRVFTIKGRGTVVTGSLRGGPIAEGAVVRREPGGEAVRIRGVQVHGQPRPAHDGGRTALNITGLAEDELRRGDVLTADPRVRGSDGILVLIASRPEGAARPGGIRQGGSGTRLRLHIGTDQVDARFRRIAGSEDAMLLSLDRPVATFAGDRGVLREPASGAVVAGLRILDPVPPRGVSRRRMTTERLAHLAATVVGPGPGSVPSALLDLHGALAPSAGAAGLPGTLELAPDVRAELDAAALALVAAHHAESPLSPGLPLPRARAALLRRLRGLVTVERSLASAATAAIALILDDAVRQGRIARTGEVLRDPARVDAVPTDLAAAMDRLEAALAVPAPPDLAAAAAAAGCPPDGIRALQADGRIVRIADDLAWAAPTFHRLAATALDLARRGPLRPATFRDATGTSRRYVLAILEDLDRRGILARTPDGHVPGPRAPGAPATVGASAARTPATGR